MSKKRKNNDGSFTQTGQRNSNFQATDKRIGVIVQ
jgi:hypothetical protein